MEPSGSEGMIAFSTNTAGGTVVINSDGSGPRQLERADPLEA
jgi:hypothetical protein